MDNLLVQKQFALKAHCKILTIGNVWLAPLVMVGPNR